MTPNVLVMALLVLLLNQYGQSQSEPFVVTRLGRIRGTLWTGSAKTILAFRGIPYAKAPVGELRFEVQTHLSKYSRIVKLLKSFWKEPVPIDPWNGTLDATKEGPECVQPNRFILKDKIKGSEDCLILNVYTLDVTDKAFQFFKWSTICLSVKPYQWITSGDGLHSRRWILLGQFNKQLVPSRQFLAT